MTIQPPTWTPERLGQLRALHDAIRVDGSRLTRREIADRLGVSHDAVIARLGREYAAGTLKQLHQHVPPGAGKQDPRRQPSAVKNHTKATLHLVGPPVIGAAPVAPAGGCQFPLWSDGQRPPLPPPFCGKPTVGGGSWCADHRCRVWDHRRHAPIPPQWGIPR